MTDLPEVLLFEDNLANKKLVEMILRGICIIDHASTAESGFEMLKTKQYKLILMDIHLGFGISGVQAAEIINENPEYENIPIIAVTAFANTNDKYRFLSQGFTDYIAKPFIKEEFIRIIKKYIP